MPNAKIPSLVKHMTIAIYRDGSIHGKNRKDIFEQCLEIAKSRCREYGFVSFSGQSLSEEVTLTSKGRKQDAKHRVEGRAKTVLFDTLYEDLDVEGTKAAEREKEAKKEKELIEKWKELNKAKFSKKERL